MFVGMKAIPLQTVQYNASEQYTDLNAGQPTVRLDCRIAGRITVASAATDTLRDDAIQRLIENVRLEWDNNRLIDNVPMRDLYEIYLHQVVREPVQTRITTANLQANASYDFALNFSIYFKNPMLVRPWDTHLPVLPVRDRLRMFVQWNTNLASAGSDPGSAAFATGATAVITFANAPTLEVTQITAPRMSGSQPAFLPFITGRVSKNWAAASTAFTERLNSGEKFVFETLRSTYGAGAILQDSINFLTFRETGDALFDRIRTRTLVAEEEEMFPALKDAPDRTGRVGILYAAGGSINNLIDPSQFTDLRYIFDLEAPVAPEGIINFTTLELRSYPGITRL